MILAKQEFKIAAHFCQKKREIKNWKNVWQVNKKKEASVFNAMNWRNLVKELLKISKISLQCKKRYKGIWNLKNVTSIDREHFKM